MADKQAEVYLFQHEADPNKVAEIPYPVQTRYQTQLVLEDKLIAESNWLNTGNLPVDRQRAREYGKAIGKELVERGVLKYALHLNERHEGLPCAHPSRSDVMYISSQFDEAIRAQLKSSE
jgi:hypothetical protein